VFFIWSVLHNVLHLKYNLKLKQMKVLNLHRENLAIDRDGNWGLEVQDITVELDNKMIIIFDATVGVELYEYADEYSYSGTACDINEVEVIAQTIYDQEGDTIILDDETLRAVENEVAEYLKTEIEIN